MELLERQAGRLRRERALCERLVAMRWPGARLGFREPSASGGTGLDGASVNAERVERYGKGISH